MKHKYLVIKSDGSLVDSEKYVRSAECSRDMKVLIEREAVGINAPVKDEQPAYLHYANKMGFRWEQNADIGFLNYDHKANFIMRLVKEYSRQLVNQIGFPIYEVQGSNMFDMKHPVVEAYAHLYADRLFQYHSEDKDLIMLYDASYPQFNLAGSYQLSHKNLPFAHFSISDCYRNEQSGECMLLFRGRRFHMPDLHPYLKDVDEAFEWYFKIEEQIIKAARDVGREYVNVVKVSSLKFWEQYQNEIIEIAKRGQKDMLVEIRQDRVDRYWIIDVDYSIIDALGQVREIGCIQIDIGNAKRLGISFRDKNNVKQFPVIIHAAVPGGIERYLYMLFDNFKGSFPLWLHPIQMRLIPVSEKYVAFCKMLAESHMNIRIDIDDRNEPVSRKVKRASEELIPFNFVVGEQERFGEGNIVAIQRAILEIQSEFKPFLQIGWPKFISRLV